MRIVNISHVSFPGEKDPMQWIKKSRFFKGIWEAVAEREEVIFIDFINYDGRVNNNGINYWFQKKSQHALQFPLRVHLSIAKTKPDVVIVHGIQFSLQLILLRIILNKKCKIVAQDHGGRIIQHPLKKILQKLVDRCVDIYFFTSQAQAKTWQNAGMINDISKVCEVIEISSVFQPEPREIALSITGIAKENTYIWVGHLNANKDPLLVVKAFTQFIESGTNAHLYMIFQSEELLPEIQNWLQLNKHAIEYIHLEGKIDHADLRHWFCSAEFIISSSHYEAGGVSVCEGMSCGCIPILSNIPSFISMTEEECGIVYETGSIQSLLLALYASSRMNVSEERKKTLVRYEKALSFQAIASRIREVLHSL